MSRSVQLQWLVSIYVDCRYELTVDTPTMLRSRPDPKYIAKASSVPIPVANTKAVETEGSNFLSAV